jgi:hypothetical protein
MGNALRWRDGVACSGAFRASGSAGKRTTNHLCARHTRTPCCSLPLLSNACGVAIHALCRWSRSPSMKSLWGMHRHLQKPSERASTQVHERLAPVLLGLQIFCAGI